MRCPSKSLFVAIALGLASGCHGGDRAASLSAARPPCEVDAALPGSAAWAEVLRDAVAAVSVPVETEAPPDRRSCNRLALAPSAFARQHALDPIDWRPWSAEALAEAKQLSRPLLVMSGFAASAACHELARGELAERRLAEQINHAFVPVIVDRVERPDVDAWLMQAVEVQTGGAGWPAVVFLQADGRPFEAWSGGAANRDDRSLARVVEQVTRRLDLGGGTIGEHADATSEKMQKRATVDTSGPLPSSDEVLASLRTDALTSFDTASGSFGPPPLFPRAPLLDALLHFPVVAGNRWALEMATTSLLKLRESPLADGIGGGFHRYATKAAWQEPAWEKMLADNAALASTYLDAAALTGRPEFRDTGLDAVDFLLRDLRLDDGAFAASLDATSIDGAGHPGDGCYYAEDGELRQKARTAPDARVRAHRERESREAPARDEVVLADANALAISALARAASVSGKGEYLDAAVEVADVLDRTLRDGGRVKHCAWSGGRLCTDGYLADQALVALAFLDLDEVKAAGGNRWLDAARAIAAEIPGRFEHEGSGGFFLDGKDAETLPLRYKPAFDGAVVSGNSAAASLYVRLAARAGDPAAAAKAAATARRTFEGFSKTLTMRAIVLPGMVTALMDWNRLPADLRGDKLRN